MRLQRQVALLATNCLLVITCDAAQVVLIDAASDSATRVQMEVACRFYGLDWQRYCVDQNHGVDLASLLRQRKMLAAVVTAEALAQWDEIADALALSNLPVMVANINSSVPSEVLARLSNGAAKACRVRAAPPNALRYRFGETREVTRQLAGQEVGLRSASDLFYFELDEKVSPDTLLSIVDSINIFQAAVLVRAQSPQGEVFLQAAMPAFYLPPETGVKEEVFRAIPVMMFLRYAGGEHCWSSPTHFANLTVDDPWLAEPYGYLSYFGLLAEMEKSNFHTTIAFIPWNFDRSTSAVGELFRRHPDRFSIAVHGNNHDHREFYKYQTSQVDYAASKSLAKQEASLRQGLARMEQFTTLTGIPYDRIMIFPQGIAPQKTLNLLKKYDFLATINGTNVPIDAATPTDPIFYLRTFTMGFENFPSAVRYWPTRSSFAIALDLFCGNPLFFYTHHHFFESGIAAFNRTAELVNKLEPGIAWRNLRTIVQSWYLERLRDDGHIDVVTFSHDFVLANRRPGNATFFVQKEETFDLPINRVTVNDQTVSYERAGDTLTFALSLPAGASRQIIIEYANDFDPAQINVSKGDLRVALLRRLSDFRDRTLSQNLAGRTLTRYYYELGLFRFGLLWLVSFLVVSGFLGLYFYRRLRKPGAIR